MAHSVELLFALEAELRAAAVGYAKKMSDDEGRTRLRYAALAYSKLASEIDDCCKLTEPAP